MIRTERQVDGPYLLEYDGRLYECDDWPDLIRKLQEIWEQEERRSGNEGCGRRAAGPAHGL